jgi:phage repressor protein C with HTH and peptisase S24 domain
VASELLPVKKTLSGTYLYEGDEYFPASVLAQLAIKGLPKSRAGIYKYAERHSWKHINVPGKGAKDGILCFLVPRAIFNNDPKLKQSPHASINRYELKVEQINPGYKDDSNDYVLIDYYVDVKGSAGPGQIIDTDAEEIVLKVKMDARLLRERVGNDFKRLKMAGVTGDSMLPTLSHGDQVVVDTHINQFIDDAIYAIMQDGYLRYKRVQKRLDGNIIVKSDNPSYGEPEIYTQEEASYFHIVGMVTPFKFGRFKI